jgi:5'-3' exonuclease
LSKQAWIDGDVLHHWSLWKTSTLQDYISNVEKNLENWCLGCITETFHVVVGGSENFRQHFYPDYKKTAVRETARGTRPVHEEECLYWLKHRPYTTVADGVEADDLLAIRATELPYETVVVTVDKDLLQVPGHHFNPRKGNRFVSPAESFRLLQEQLLKGDPVDKIPGLPKVGEKTAEKLLDAGRDPVDVYKEVLGKDWEKSFLFNGKLLFLLRHADDAFSLDRYTELKNYANSQRALEFCSEGFESV